MANYSMKYFCTFYFLFSSFTLCAQDKSSDNEATALSERAFLAGWIKDSSGCDGFRSAHTAELSKKAYLIKGKSYEEVVKILGKPDVEQTDDIQNNIIIYRLGCTDLLPLKPKAAKFKVIQPPKEGQLSKDNFSILIIEIRRSKCRKFEVVQS
jgi:hypothetical protein